MSNNTTILLGRLTADPDLRTLPGEAQRSVVELRLAVDRPGKDKPTDFIPVSLYGRDAEVVHHYSAKGLRIQVTGRLRVDTWGEGDDRKFKTYVVADSVQLIDYKPRPEDNGSAPAEQTQPQEVAA